MVESDFGEGSTLTILFPALEEESGKLTGDGEPLKGKGKESEVRGRVLVAENDEAVLGMVTVMPEVLGYSVLPAVDGQKAVEMFKEHADELSLVTLDLTMPRKSGEGAFAEIHGIKADVPVVLSSGYSESELRERFAQKGIVGFIQKPCRQESLAATIAGALGGGEHLP